MTDRTHTSHNYGLKKPTRNHSGKVIPWTSAEHLKNNFHLHLQQCSEGSQQLTAECQAQHPARESVWHPFPTPPSPGKAGTAPCSTPGHSVHHLLTLPKSHTPLPSKLLTRLHSSPFSKHCMELGISHIFMPPQG